MVGGAGAATKPRACFQTRLADGASPTAECPAELHGQPPLTQLTVVAEVVVPDWASPEGMQPLASIWAPDTSPGLGDAQAFDAGGVNGLDCRAYFGATFDGRYVYYAPQHTEVERVADGGPVEAGWPASGRVLRYDTHAPDFRAGSAFESFDAGQTDGLETKGFYGAAFDGRHVYFVPRQADGGFHTRVLRYDTEQPFKAASSWEAHDVGDAPAHSSQGVVMTTEHIYLMPGFTGP
jgi:hypothetical protein